MSVLSNGVISSDHKCNAPLMAVLGNS